MTGAEISTHNAAAEPLNILCIEDGAGFFKNHFYVIGEDGVITDVFTVHDHTSSGTGGTYFDIKRANYGSLIEIDRSINSNATDYAKTVVGTGTITDQIDETAGTKFTQFLTTAANNDLVNGEAGGGRLFFGKPITLQIKYAVSHNTSINYRMGCGQPRLNSAVGVTSQMGFEGCTGTDALNRVFSADGSAWSAEPMSNMVNAVPLGLRIDYYPSSKIVASDGEGEIVIKTANLPPVGTATNAIATWRVGVKTLTAATRNLKIYAMRLVGSSYDSESGIKGWCHLPQ